MSTLKSPLPAACAASSGSARPSTASYDPERSMYPIVVEQRVVAIERKYGIVGCTHAIMSPD
jgi:hypothetical protein